MVILFKRRSARVNWLNITSSSVSLVRALFLSFVNIHVVVGDQEMKGREVNVRNRDDTSSQDRGKPVPLQEAIAKLVALRDERRSDNPFPGDARVEEEKETKAKA